MTARIPLPGEFAVAPFTYADARAHGIGEGRLRNPELTRPFRGVRFPRDAQHTPAGLPVEHHAIYTLCRGYAPRLTAHQHFSHATAAVLWGVPFPRRMLAASGIHVTAVRPALAPRAVGVFAHHSGGTGQICDRYGLPVSDPIATWFALGPVLELDDLVAAGDHLILDPRFPSALGQRPFTTIDALTTALDGFSGRGARKLRAAIQLLREGAESRPETLLRLLLQRAKLPEPGLNQDLYDRAGGFLGRVDLVWPGFRVIAEYDGDQHRTNTAQYEKDQGRTERFVDEGWRFVKVRSRGLFTAPLETVDRVTNALIAGGWQRERDRDRSYRPRRA